MDGSGTEWGTGRGPIMQVMRRRSTAKKIPKLLVTKSVSGVYRAYKYIYKYKIKRRAFVSQTQKCLDRFDKLTTCLGQRSISAVSVLYKPLAL